MLKSDIGDTDNSIGKAWVGRGLGEGAAKRAKMGNICNPVNNNKKKKRIVSKKMGQPVMAESQGTD